MPGDVAKIDLLCGLLGLRLDLINASELLLALRTWVAEGSARPLGAVLVERGAIDGPTCELLDRLAARHLRAHGGDIARSLAALGPFPDLAGGLRTIEDDALRAVLEWLVAAPTAHTVAIPGGEHAGATPPSTVIWNPNDCGADLGLEWDEPGPEPDYGRYTILRPIARGGLGEVFVARDEGLHREVALKVILPRLADYPRCCARFLIEAEITGGLEHPGIVPVYAIGRCADGRPFYSMRLIRGEGFDRAIDRFHAVTDRQTRSRMLRALLRHFVNVCNVVAYAHSRGIIHRDIKPANILLGRYGETLLVDWGLAKPLGRPDPTGPEAAGDREPALQPAAGTGVTPTVIGSTMGTPRYMSPEQANGDPEQVGLASDIYGLGATLYCLLCGHDPLKDLDDPAEILRRVAAGAIPPPRSVRPDASTTLELICLKAMALRPEDRYASARALADDIENWLVDLPTSVPQRLGRRLGRWERRHRVLIRVMGTVLLIALLAALLGGGRP